MTPYDQSWLLELNVPVLIAMKVYELININVKLEKDFENTK